MKSSHLRLPLPHERLTPQRKSTIVLAVQRGEITRVQAIKRYALSHEELTAWERDFDAHGTLGLCLASLRESRT